MLHFDLKVNGRTISTVLIQRADSGYGVGPADVHTYRWTVGASHRDEASGTVSHRYGDGAMSLVAKVAQAFLSQSERSTGIVSEMTRTTTPPPGDDDSEPFTPEFDPRASAERIFGDAHGVHGDPAKAEQRIEELAKLQRTSQRDYPAGGGSFATNESAFDVSLVEHAEQSRIAVEQERRIEELAAMEAAAKPADRWARLKERGLRLLTRHAETHVWEAASTFRVVRADGALRKHCDSREEAFGLARMGDRVEQRFVCIGEDWRKAAMPRETPKVRGRVSSWVHWKLISHGFGNVR